MKLNGEMLLVDWGMAVEVNCLGKSQPYSRGDRRAAAAASLIRTHIIWGETSDTENSGIQIIDSILYSTQNSTICAK
jgi:hypothetical protein